MARDRNITTFSSLEVVPSTDNPNSPDNGFYFPRLTTEQRDSIDVVSDSRGCTIFNTTTKQLETLSENSTWGAIGGGGGGSVFENITVTDTTTTNTLVVTEDATVSDLTASTLEVTNATHLNALFAQDTNVSNFTADGVGIFNNSVDVVNDVNVGRYFTGSTPIGTNSLITVTLGGGAGTGSTYQMYGSVMSGHFQLTIPTGTTFSDTVIATFTMPASEDFTSYGFTNFSPANETAALGMTTKAIYSKISQLGVGGTPTQVQLLIADAHELDSNVTYVWEYFIMGNKQLF